MKTTWILIVVAAGALQWMVCALRSAFSREAFPKSGIRKAERALLASSFLLLLSFAPATDIRALWRGDAKVTTVSVVTSTPRTSCASIDVGMSESEVKSRLGPPDETRSDEETRGPGASILIYQGSRCGVHLFDGRVEFVD